MTDYEIKSDDDLEIALELIRMGDRHQPNCLMLDLVSKLLDGKLSERERDLLAEGLAWVSDSDQAHEFFNGGIKRDERSKTDRQLDVYFFVLEVWEAQPELNFGQVCGLAMEQMEYTPANCSNWDERSDQFVKDYKVGQRKMRQYLKQGIESD